MEHRSRRHFPSSTAQQKSTTPTDISSPVKGERIRFIPEQTESLIIQLERDRWVWAINAEMERQVRAHTKQENALREYGKVPAR